ncbi:MAG: redox-sensing transcriptional repressor Rex [Acidimicrobiales bacterium]
MPATSRPLPQATVARLPLYLRALGELAGRDAPTVSSDLLAETVGVNAAQVRKDLSHLGSLGTRGAGYDVEVLLGRIRAELGLTREWPVVIVGLGNLGRALALYGGLAARGFKVAALVDADPSKVGARVGGVAISPYSELVDVVRARRVSVAVIATPAAAAQAVADALVRAGVTAVLSFAPVSLSVPEGVALRQVDLSTELQILSFHQTHRDEPHPQAVPGVAGLSGLSGASSLSGASGVAGMSGPSGVAETA